MENTNIKEQERIDDDEIEFNPCSECDGHSACEDFGCAIELGLAWMLIPPTSLNSNL